MLRESKLRDELQTARVGGWTVESRPPDLSDRWTHVWAVRLDEREGRKEIGALLSDEEHARARRFLADAPRRRFVLARAALRLLLGMYVGVDPARLAFEQTTLGKPVLCPLHDVDIRFNVAHADDLALAAFARGTDIGVDLERRRLLPEAEALAAQYFAPIEARAVAACAADEQADAFIRFWTRKEAIAKATGEGLTRPFGSFLVPSDKVVSHHVVEVSDPRGKTTLLALHTLEPDPDYIGALAVGTTVSSVRATTLDLEGIIGVGADRRGPVGPRVPTGSTP
jgi:4'-phosphopantetheinyl transferase